MEYKKLPDLKSLATLRAVVELGGVNQAARSLHVGQPAITKRLRALESCYEIALMEKIAGRLRLTPAGEKVYVIASQVMERHNGLLEDLEQIKLGGQRLRLEVTSTIGEHLLPELLLQFAEHYPRYKIDSRMGYSRRILTSLVTGLTDLALLENAPDHPDILVQKWLDDELVMVCGRSHPLAGIELLPVDALKQYDYVLREKHSSSREHLSQALTSIGIADIKVALEIGSTETIVEILSRGRHVSFLPRFAVSEDIALGKLFHVKVQGFRIMRTLWIARNRSMLDHPVAEAFIETLRSH
ncbi:MAG: LysR family transcriptional regulator [Gammaproteobacteria bacterium]